MRKHRQSSPVRVALEWGIAWRATIVVVVLAVLVLVVFATILLACFLCLPVILLRNRRKKISEENSSHE